MRVVVENMFREIEFGHNNMIDKSFSVRDRLKREGYNQYRYYLWDSNIFTKRADGIIEFSFCNWSTQTTKERISNFLWHETNFKCYVHQKDFNMYLTIGDSEILLDTSKTYTINPKTREVKVK